MFPSFILVTAVCGGGPYPLLPLTNATTSWVTPNPKLPYPVGPNPGLAYAYSHSAASSSRSVRQPPAPAYKQGLLLGDVRARLHVSAVAAANQSVVTAQVFWRRRDQNVSLKAVVVTDSNG